MKLIKKQDENGNDYYEEILETKEEMRKSINYSKKKRNKKNIISLIIFIVCLFIIIIAGLILFNKISIDVLGDKQKFIAYIGLILGIAGIGEATKIKK